MIVWKGWGLLALLVPLLCSWSANFVLDSIYGDGFYQGSSWAMPLVLGLASIPVGVFGYRWNNMPGRILIDPANDEVVELRSVHSMFWIPLQYWALIIVGIALWLYAANVGWIYASP